MKNKGILWLLLVLVSVGIIGGCGANNAGGTVAEQEKTDESAVTDENIDEDVDGAEEDVIILYTNDIHSYINNSDIDDDGNETKKLRYSSVSAMKKGLIAEGKNVLLVDAGDHSQGTAFGGLDEAKHIIGLMNASGYDLATLGNHDFDYGLFRTFGIIDEADYDYVSCNFYSIEEDKSVFDSSRIYDIGGKKIAFIGISTPETLTACTPAYFMDESQEEYIYSFKGGDDGKELYACVQQAIDEVRDEVDYVIALGHLGVDLSSEPYRSTDVISHVTGLDAFIDGHSHTTMESEEVADAEGKKVLLTQTGSYLATIGQMTISADGEITTQLIEEYDNRDEAVVQLEDAWIDEVNSKLGEEIAVNDITAYIMNPDNPDERIVRKMETNMGDIDADAIYYYFNEILKNDCDITIANGGGIRAGMEPGAVTYLTAKSVNPFGNVVCMIEASGQEILDTLEIGATRLGGMDPTTGYSAEGKGFMQVAGIKYDVDMSIDSQMELDEDGMFVASPSEYRVNNVCVYNRQTGQYEPLDLDKTYRIGGINYLLRNMGDGLSHLADNVCIVDYVDEDYLVLSEYIKSFETGEDGKPHINSANSQLSKYDGYLLDYENPYGSGRITIK